MNVINLEITCGHFVDIMGKFEQNNFDFGPVVQNMSFKEKIYKWHTMGILA